MTGGSAAVIDLIVGVGAMAVAVVALTAASRMASVVSFLVFGVLLSVLWALAGAPDVALAEAAIGAGVTGVLFVATVRGTAMAHERPDPSAARPSSARVGGSHLRRLAGAAATVGAAAALTAGLGPALWHASRPLGDASVGLTDALAGVLPLTGVDHGVTGVLLNLRSYDTLLEMAVVLAAVLVVVSLSGPDPRTESTVPPVQRSATALLVPVLLLLAAWLLFAGSTRPGGAFQSGAVLAGVVILLHLAARPVLPPGRRRSTAVAAGGLLSFVLVAAVGPLLLGGPWLQLAPAWAGTLIIVLESLLAVSIGASLALIALAMRAEEAR